jgi:hypothetical protein
MPEGFFLLTDLDHKLTEVNRADSQQTAAERG